MLPLAYASTNPAAAASLFASVTAIAPLTYLLDDRSPVLRSWARNFTPDAVTLVGLGPQARTPAGC